MANVTSSNLIPLCILRILEKYSAPQTPITQEELGELLIRDFGVSCERKALGRTLNRMRDELDLDIPTSGKGCWLASRLFGEDDLQLLVDMVLASDEIGEEKKNSLFDKLCSLSSVNFRNEMVPRRRERMKKQAQRRLWLRSDSDKPSEVMGKIRDAIRTKRQISITCFDNGSSSLSLCRIVSPRSLTIQENGCILTTSDESGKLREEFHLRDLSDIHVAIIPSRAFTGDSGLQSDAS